MRCVCTTFTLLIILALTAFAQRTSNEYPATAPDIGQAQQSLDSRGPVFIENGGQWDRQVKFLLRSGGLDMWITEHGVRYDLFKLTPAEPGNQESNALPAVGAIGIEPQTMMRTGHVVGISFEGASFAPPARGIEQQPGVHNYFIGNDPSRWASGVRLFAEARIDRLYDGIDAIFYLDEGRPRYDLIVAPGADPGQVGMKIEGGNGVSVSADGSLLIATTMGAIEQRGLYAYQEIAGERRQVECQFVVTQDDRVRFALGSYDRTHPLVIDPLVYSTYLGSNGPDECTDIAVDGSGSAYVIGTTSQTDFPTLNQYQTLQSNVDVFVTKLAYNGSGSVSLAYSTFLGGNNSDFAYGIAVDGSGDAYVTGQTSSTDFPTLNAYQAYQSGQDAFVTKLVHNGSGNVTLAYSTYLGGNNYDLSKAIAVDGSGNAYVTGFTRSTNFPTFNAYQADQPGEDAFVTKLVYNGSGSVSVAYSTYLGGNSGDGGRGIAVDGSGNAYVTGGTGSPDFPMVNPYQSVQVNGSAFVAKLAYSGSGNVVVVYSTCLGGSQGETINAIAVDGSGNAYVTGETYSTDFPMLNPYQTTHAGFVDAFVTKLAYNGSGSVTLVYSTFLGGKDADTGNDIAIDANGNAYITGYTTSSNFPTANAYQDTYQSSSSNSADAFVTKLAYGGSGNVTLAYSTYLAGSMQDFGNGIAVDGNGNTYVGGQTGSTDFPTQNQFQSDSDGLALDVFVAKFSLPDNPLSVEPTGSNLPASNHAVTPNQVRDEMQLSFTLPGAMVVTMEIYSLDGRLVSIPLHAQPREAGRHTQRISVSELPPGVYTLRVVAGDGWFVERFIVVR